MRNNVWMTIILFSLMLAIRLPFLSSTPYEYDSWRQSDTEAMAILFDQHRFNIFYPQLNYNGPLPNYVQLEFQITSFLIAVLYKMFGYHYELARIVPVLFFMGSAWFVYLIAKASFGQKIAWTAALFYGILPIDYLYSRAIMPESAALFFYSGTYYWFTRWISQKKSAYLYAAAIFFDLSIAEKVPSALIGIPLFALAFVQFGTSVWRKKELWLFLIISLAPVTCYYIWLGQIAESPFVNGIASKHILPSMGTALFSQPALSFFRQTIPVSFTWTVLVLGIFGFFSLKWRIHYGLVVWLLAVLVEFTTIVAVIKFNYYMIFLSPILCILAASSLMSFRYKTIRYAIAVIAIIVCSYESERNVMPALHSQKTSLIRQAEAVRLLTGPNDLIVTGVDDPSLLNASHRQGWRITNALPGDLIGELRLYIKNGAAYFVPLNGYIESDDGRLKRFLEENFVKIEPEAGYPIYKLISKQK